MQITPIETIGIGLIPDTTHIKHATAAAKAFEQAALCMDPLGIPEDPAVPDVTGARAAFQVAVRQLELTLEHAGGRPGHLEVEVALEEAQEALMHLARPGVNPPVADVVNHAWRGGEYLRTAIAEFDRNPDAWIMGPGGVA